MLYQLSYTSSVSRGTDPRRFVARAAAARDCSTSGEQPENRARPKSAAPARYGPPARFFPVGSANSCRISAWACSASADAPIERSTAVAWLRNPART